ncbi:MAG: hypothetical protein ABIJ33_02025 [Patescibacteria group bacterium]
MSYTNSYTQQKNQAYKKYKAVGGVYCPYLKEKVTFNSHGFRHMVYRNQKNKRDQKTQSMRFNLLPKAVKLLKLTTTIQEKDTYQSLVRSRQHGVEQRGTKATQYYGFIAIIDGWKIKVIVKKIGQGKLFFWSVIPNWVTSQKWDQGKRYINYTGDLDKD